MGAKMTVTTQMLGNTRVGRFTNVKSLDAAATVQEAINKGYVVGKKELVVSAVSGVTLSMAAGVSRDGNGRKIDEVVSVQPSIRCKLDDNCEPVTKDNVDAKLLCRVLKEGEVDATDWSFTIEGATSDMVIESVTTGEVLNVVVIGKAIDFNGEGLDVGTSATLAWSAVNGDASETKTGSIEAAKRTASESRITTAADVLSSLTGSGWEGGTIVFTLTNGTKKAIKSATLRVAQ